MNVVFEQHVTQIMRHGVPRSPQFVLRTQFQLHTVEHSINVISTYTSVTSVATKTSYVLLSIQ